jgi:lisH domain-containing protein FOPNL
MDSPLTSALAQSDQTTSSLGDLKTALTQTLKYTGVYSKLESTIRTEIYKTLANQGGGGGGAEIDPPGLPNDNLVINSLILEYLKFNGYGQTASILASESGHPTDSAGEDASGIERDFVMSDLNVRNTSGSQKVPVLYGIVEKLRELKVEGITSNIQGRAIDTKTSRERKQRTKKFVNDIAGGLKAREQDEGERRRDRNNFVAPNELDQSTGEVGGGKPSAIVWGGC